MNPKRLLFWFLLFWFCASAFGADTYYKITAYCPCEICCGRGAAGIMANGREVHVGAVAADWRVLKKGSQIEIAGLGKFSVEDTGRLVKGRHIDVFMWSHADAKRFGVKWLRVKTVDKPKKRK